MEYQNELIHETSPYLLQHAKNPVNWVPWTDDIFEKAKAENKMVLVSVGYSACHWCHVMEHESFEDEEVATLMNKFFINVKVDREERPDVDQVYMTAVQLMTQKGGWPLNCFTLPDGRPIYGGTYFPKEQWMHILKSLNHAFNNELLKLEDYAENLHKGIIASELIAYPEKRAAFAEDKLKEMIQRWSKSFDKNQGGGSRAPKFPLPSNYEFLLDYALNTKDQELQSYVFHSLDKIAMGGIYDQIGGGFSRYSVDLLWKVPHFEKMLYDNGQLLSLYANAYRITGSEMYKTVVYQTVEWLEREMLTPEGAFYSALDADSEGVEGKFYVWTEDELKEILGDDFTWVSDYYEINQRGYWEEGNYILLRTKTDEEFAKTMNWKVEDLQERVVKVNEQLLSHRDDRVRPGLDDKCLTSWNAMTLKGLADAYAVFRDEKFLVLALRNAHWLCKNQLRENGGLWRNFKDGKSNIEAFLEDYAHTINALIGLYEVTMDDQWLKIAKDLCDFTLQNFFDEKSGMFFFTEEKTTLIARKMELNDNVIPASNSVMARNLFYLGRLYHDDTCVQRAEQMLSNIYDGMEMYGSGYSNWGMLLNHLVYGLHEVVVVGEDAENMLGQLQKEALPKVLFAGTKGQTEVPIFEGKLEEETTRIHVCTQGVCYAPSESVKEALNELAQ